MCQKVRQKERNRCVDVGEVHGYPARESKIRNEDRNRYACLKRDTWFPNLKEEHKKESVRDNRIEMVARDRDQKINVTVE